MDFYKNEYQQVANACGYTPEAAQCISQIHELGLRTVLATNPLFPALATHSRVRWAGLQVSDFELITTYENSSLCKPNPDYYRDIMDKLNLQPEEITMVGNDMQEDMLASAAAGITKRYFVTDHPINRDGTPVTMPHGALRDFPAWLKAQ